MERLKIGDFTMKKTNLKARYAHLYVGQKVSYQGKEVTIVAKWPQFHQFQFYNPDGSPQYGGLDECKPLEGQRSFKFQP